MSARGYTLVELLVVLAVLGLLAAVAVPRLTASRPGLETRAAARLLASDLAAVRQDAIDRGIEERVVLEAERYTAPGRARVLAKGLKLTVAGAARGVIVFYADGSTSGGTVTIFGGGARHSVTVRWPGGRIGVE